MQRKTWYSILGLDVKYSDQKIRGTGNSLEILKRMTNVPIRKLDGINMKLPKLQEKCDQYSYQIIIRKLNSYEILLIRDLDDHGIL